jgi:hypothetical protein
VKKSLTGAGSQGLLIYADRIVTGSASFAPNTQVYPGLIVSPLNYKPIDAVDRKQRQNNGQSTGK